MATFPPIVVLKKSTDHVQRHHGKSWTKVAICIHFKMEHESNNKQCPEYERQFKIKAGIAQMRESYKIVSRLFPINYKPNLKNTVPQIHVNTYAQAANIPQQV